MTGSYIKIPFSIWKNNVNADSSDDFFSSPLWFFILIASCAVPYCYGAYAVSFGLCAAYMCVALVCTRNIMPSFAAFLFCSVAVIELHGITQGEIFGYAWVLIPVVPALIYHIVRFNRARPKYRPGKTVLPQAAVSVVLLIGGAGYLSAEQYFRIEPMYYVLFLGAALTGMTVLLENDLPDDGEYAASYLSATMMAIAALLLLMWLAAFLSDGNAGFPYRQWKNNAGNFMLLSVPLTLWRGSKARCGTLHAAFAVLQAFSVAASGSRGATLMMGIVLPSALAVYFFGLKGKRKLFESALFAVFAVAVCAVLFADGARRLHGFFGEMDILDGHGREKLYAEGWKNFLQHPLFGVGLAYRNDDVYPLNDMAIFWYHSTPVQILASTGAIGFAAYAWQFLVRMKIAFKRNSFNIMALIGFLGFEGYSCVNTGDFTPLPFAVLAVFIFLVLERYTKTVKDGEDSVVAHGKPNNKGEKT